jgi:tRNA-specific 2-thiouridylase
MLARLTQEQLCALVLPLGDMTKDEIRKRAEEAGISSSKKRDSQEICFIPDGDYASYIEKVSGTCEKGDFIDPEGRPLGQHNGIIRYTVGQRKGLGIALGKRVFVSAIDASANTVML